MGRLVVWVANAGRGTIMDFRVAALISEGRTNAIEFLRTPLQRLLMNFAPPLTTPSGAHQQSSAI